MRLGLYKTVKLNIRVRDRMRDTPHNRSDVVTRVWPADQELSICRAVSSFKLLDNRRI